MCITLSCVIIINFFFKFYISAIIFLQRRESLLWMSCLVSLLVGFLCSNM